MAKQQKLELTWIGKGDQPRLEPRILIEDPDKSFGEAGSGNMLIHGDNLLALKALQQDYAGRIRCIFIDPPYNTGAAFTHYDDGIEHSIWLNLMKQRLELLRDLLTPDGSIYISIDFNEVHYLKVLMDEIFGRDCFQREIIWRMGWLSGFKTGAKNYIRNHDTILYYTRNPEGYYFNKAKAYIPREEFNERYNSGQKKEILELLTSQGLEKDIADEVYAQISTLGLPERYPMEDTWNSSVYDKLNSINVVSFAGEKVSKMLGVAELKGQKSEALIRRILDISTEPGDYVLDSFLGTGTTAAVAHKMGRKWIGIELGDHANTHALPRLQKVVDGSDNSGVTSICKWKGGGGFSFYELAPSLLSQDQFGNWVISKDYDANMLAHAVAKQEGFSYRPSQTTWWKQGASTEKDFILTTTQFISLELLDSIHGDMQPTESLLIACKAFDEACTDRYDNITVKKIPQVLLGRCEFGKEDYSLNVGDATNDPYEAELAEEGIERVDSAGDVK